MERIPSNLQGTFSNPSEKVTLLLSHIDQRKFVVPFQGGYDGDNP